MVKLFSKNSNLCDHNQPTSQTDGQTDRQTTCDRNTALCTKLHRAVIKHKTRHDYVCSQWRPATCLPAFRLRTSTARWRRTYCCGSPAWCQHLPALHNNNFNDLVGLWRALSKTDISAVKEPSGLLREPMVNDRTTSHSYHGRIEGVSHGTSQRRMRSPFLAHFLTQPLRTRSGCNTVILIAYDNLEGAVISPNHR